MNVYDTNPPSIRSQDVTKVWSQNLYGSEPGIGRTFQGGNMKLIYVPLVDTFEVQNQNYGSESNIDHLYWGENPRSSTAFQNRITEIGKNQISIIKKEGLVMCWVGIE